MKAFGKGWGEALVLAGGAGLVAAALAAAYAPIVWKLAQQTLFYADLDGLRELMSTQALPGGLLAWLSRGCQVTGLGSAFVWLHGLAAAGTVLLWRRVFAAQRQGLGPLLSFPAALLPVYPALLAGTAVWLLDDYAAAFRNTFGLWTALGVYALARRTKAWVGALAAVLLFPALGYYPLLGAVAASIWCLPLAAVPAVASVLLYHDLSLDCAYLNAGAIFDRMRWCALNVWTAGAFACFFAAAACDRFAVPALPAKVQRAVTTLARFRWAVFAGVAAVLVAGVWLCRPKPDLRGQMARERAVVAHRWADVLATPPRNPNALRMESAYRILALQRLDRLPAALFDEPLWSSQDGTDAQEELMDGHELLFAYGLLLPARRYLYETMATKHWMPRHFQLLGDVAFLFDEKALAERNYRLLLRCPYYRDFARSRLALLWAEKAELPPDLAAIASLARTVNAMLTANKVEFFDIQQNAEQLVYNHFINVKNCDSATARFCLACMLLKKKHATLALNRKLLEGLFGGPAGIPPVLQQALVVSGTYPADGLSPAVQQQALAYRTDAQRVSSGQLDQGLFLSRWASSYFFYNDFVK